MDEGMRIWLAANAASSPTVRCGPDGVWSSNPNDQAAAQVITDALAERDARIAELEAERDNPQVADFTSAVALEAMHQRARWGSDHDAGKTPFDWFWLIGYLSQKAADAAVRGDNFKALHHTVSTAAALANWHTALAGGDAAMRPGILPGEEAIARQALEATNGTVCERGDHVS